MTDPVEKQTVKKQQIPRQNHCVAGFLSSRSILGANDLFYVLLRLDARRHHDVCAAVAFEAEIYARP